MQTEEPAKRLLGMVDRIELYLAIVIGLLVRGNCIADDIRDELRKHPATPAAVRPAP